MSKKTSFEYVKYVFSEEEKKEIAQNMARMIEDKSLAEDELKAVKADYKSRIDSFVAQVNNAATKLNNGYEMRNMECEVMYDREKRNVAFYLVSTGELVKERKMTNEEM